MVKDYSKFKNKRIYGESGLRSMFFNDFEPTFIQRPSKEIFGSIPTSLQYEVLIAKMEYMMSVFDLKFVPAQFSDAFSDNSKTSREEKLISYLNRSICPVSNSDTTNDELGENIAFDLNYNLGECYSSEVICAFQELCASNYCKVKGGKDFDSNRDDLHWHSFIQSSCFEYLIALQATCDYTHKEVRYVKTLIPNEDIYSELKFLLVLDNNEDDHDNRFNLARDTKLLAEALTRLINFSFHPDTKHISFAMLTYIRRFNADFVEHERDKIRKILSFTQSEARLMFRRKEDLTFRETEERQNLLERHRKLRANAINSHR